VIKDKPFVTYHVNTFNRVHLLKNLLYSFEACNVYPNFEWVIMDYGSNDGTREFIFEFMKTRDYVTAVFGNEEKYFDILETKGLRPPNRRKKAHSIFGTSRNVARKVGKSDIFIDIADDHQFFVKCDWISEMLEVIDHRSSIVGENDISSIIYRGLSYPRIMKENNRRYPLETTTTAVNYYRCVEKRYDDYHLTTREMYEKIGEYFTIEKETDKKRIEDWNAGIDSFCQYRDYLGRSNEMNLQKVFMKYPVVVDFPQPSHPKINVEQKDIIVPIVDYEEYKNNFKYLQRPVSTEEIFAFCGYAE